MGLGFEVQGLGFRASCKNPTRVHVRAPSSFPGFKGCNSSWSVSSASQGFFREFREGYRGSFGLGFGIRKLTWPTFLLL